MRVIMTGGGSAGHINPAISIADKIKKENPDAEILFVGAKGRMETSLVPKAGYKIETIGVSGFQRKLNLKNIGKNIVAGTQMFTSSVESGRILKTFKPDVVVGTGGFVSGPLLRKAAKMNIPTLVHESNAYPGITVKMLAKYVDVVMISSENAKKYITTEKGKPEIVLTGNPLNLKFASLNKKESREKLKLDDRPLILSFGGSLGAENINKTMAEILIESAKENEWQHIHATGKSGYQKMKETLFKAKVINVSGLDVREYIENMPLCMAAADLVISRSGAMTLSEILAAGKPSILIPSPYVAENHQVHNAVELVQKGAAVCIEEKDLSFETLWSKIDEIVSSKEVLDEMSKKALSMAVTNSNDRIYNCIIDTVKSYESK